jgi:hypothetical protein
MAGPYLNDPGYEVPDNKILVVPFNPGDDGYYKDVILDLKGETKRDWWNPHFYYCLPLNIGNQQGFLIKSARNFDVTWDGTFNSPTDLTINFHDEVGEDKQTIHGGFSSGIVTVQNRFSLKTPPGVNLMTIQPPNMFLPGCVALTGLIETDQIRRDFTFNFKLTIPNMKVTVKVGDPLGAFIPVPRYFMDKFTMDVIDNHFPKEVHHNELGDLQELVRQRLSEDKNRPHESGRKYFNGIHAFGEKYKEHQKKIT